MSYPLWRYLFEDDVENFRRYLARATFDRSAARTGNTGSHVPKIGSPGTLSTSPKTPPKPRKNPALASSLASKGTGTVLTRADINEKDTFGRTLLHHAASSRSPDAVEFVKALLDVPFLDLYVQDTESGWTALHRALYFGNIATAQALMVKDIQNATDYTTSAHHVHAGGLVKIKDHEGNSPFEVFGLTIAPRILLDSSANAINANDAESVNSLDLIEDSRDGERSKRQVPPLIDLRGDEVFAFGSNKNLTLGLGDEDDRHYPERIHLNRPSHLLQHLYEEQIASRQKQLVNEDLNSSTVYLNDNTNLPAIIQNHRMTIQDVIMSKLHTAVLTNDPVSNLYICGFGPGGRLGTGDQVTRFGYVCIHGGGLAKRRVSSISLGQDHSIAVCSSGEVFTWGSNRYGQLGYELPEVPSKETPLQLLPRQLYGLIKREQIIGAAASSLHSAIFTSSALYTFGKNDGQLGLMDADARSLEIQILPRRVGVSIIQSTIQSVSAIDRATVVLLDNHDVIVFTHYGWTRVAFALEGFTNYFISEALTTRYNMETNYVRRIATAGNTICAISSYGEVFTIDVPKKVEAVPSHKSTTNPTKARNALPVPTKVWSIKKSHMAAIDAAVGQDGSILLCTASGTVWKKEKRANIKSVHFGSSQAGKPKDYKFVRIPNITRAIAVRSNAFGAFMAIRKDSDVTNNQINVQPSKLWDDLFPLLAFHNYGEFHEDENTPNPEPRFWRPAIKGPCPALIKRALLINKQAEDDFLHLGNLFNPLSASQYDVWITSNVTEVRLPVHAFVLKARSKILRKALADFQETYYFAIPDLLAIEYGSDGQVQIQFQGADFLTIANLTLYFYSDTVIDVWHHTSKALQLAPRYRSIRQELMKIATALELRQLERSVRIMVDPLRSLKEDFDTGFPDADLYSDADVVIDLADEQERYAHSKLLCARCPFFEGLFHGRTGGMWMANRRNASEEASALTRVDLKHMDAAVFEVVLRHIYSDTGEELFDDVVSKDTDSFMDVVIEVMSAANELMLDRLAQVCQSVIGRFVTTRNVCGLLNTIAESSVNEFKHAALEYICLNLESMLEQRLLEELDEYLLEELDSVVRENQLAYMPFARSDRAQQLLLEQNPDLAVQLEQARQRRLDSMRLRTRLVDDDDRRIPKQKIRVEEDLPFTMDEDHHSPATKNVPEITSPSLGPMQPKLSRPSFSRLSSSEGATDEMHIAGHDTDASSVATTPRLASSSFVIQEQQERYQNNAKVWSTPLKTPEKIGLKDIMEQTSSSKISNLTQSLRAAEVQHVNKPAVKMSQKERKRQQQEAREHPSLHEHLAARESSQTMGEAKSPTSPWKTMMAHPKSIPTSQSSSGAVNPGTNRTSSMLPDQTVAEAGVSRTSAPHPPQERRSISNPTTYTSSTAAPPQIQSIRHAPMSVRAMSAVNARTSMADILAQQETEKTAVKEAVAKKSLQEIQQEQEFQEWWDQESQRVQEEEAAAIAAASRRGKAVRGSRRKMSTQSPGMSSDSSKSSAARPASDSVQKDSPAKLRGNNLARGSGRGRGSALRGRARGQPSHN